MGVYNLLLYPANMSTLICLLIHILVYKLFYARRTIHEKYNIYNPVQFYNRNTMPYIRSQAHEYRASAIQYPKD